MRWKEEKSWPLEEEEKNNYSLLPFAGLPRRIHARAKRDACMFWELSTCSRCWYQQTFKQMAGSSLKHAPSRSRETSLPFFAHLHLQLRRRRKSFSKQQQKTIQKQRLLCLLAPAQPAQPERGDVDGAARARHQDGRGKERLSWEGEREEKEEKTRNSSRPRTEALDDDLKKKNAFFVSPSFSTPSSSFSFPLQHFNLTPRSSNPPAPPTAPSRSSSPPTAPPRSSSTRRCASKRSRSSSRRTRRRRCASPC